MRREWTEAQLEFDFSSLRSPVERPEKRERSLKVVDFVFRYRGETWFIECKDPEAAPVPHRLGALRAAWQEIRNEALMKEHLLPKLYGTSAYLVLNSKLQRGRIRYAVVIGLATLDAATRIVLTDAVQRIVNRIGPRPGRSRYAPVVEIHNLASWNLRHPEMPVTRHR